MADHAASLESIYRVARAVSGGNSPYCFVGGIALGAWGIPRATFDIDLAVAGDLDNIALAARLEREGIDLDDAFATGFRDEIAGMPKVHAHVAAGRSMMAVDVFFASTPFLQSVLERRVAIDLGAGDIYVCTAADLLLLKLIANRPKDRIDADNLLTIQGLPDAEYLRPWAVQLGVDARLDRLLAERGREA